MTIRATIRQFLLLSVAICILAFLCSHYTQLAHASDPGTSYSGAYQGNPNPRILEITPEIVCSRVGPLKTPAFIQCSASATSAKCSGLMQCNNGTSINPYEDLEFTWNFGDPKGNEIFTNPLSGAAVGANDHQWGPEATYVYRSAGRYSITLTVRGCSEGAGKNGRCSGAAYTTATKTIAVVVGRFDAIGGEHWFSVSGNDNWPCTQLAPCRTIAKLNTLITKFSNQRFHLNCGDVFSSNIGINMKNRELSYSGIRIDAAGPSCPGTCPVINISSGTNLPLNIEQSGPGTQSDIVISGICFANSDSAKNDATIGLGADNQTTGTIHDVYFDHITNIDRVGTSGLNGYNIEPTRGAVLRNVAIWGGTVSAPLAGVDCTGILGGSQEWYSIVGVTVSGNGSQDPIRCHHIYIHGQQHILVRWNIGGKSDPTGSFPTRNYTVKTSYDNADDAIPPGGFYAEYILVSENDLHGTTFGRNIANNYNNPRATRYRFYVDQQNLYDHLPGAQETGIVQPWTAETFTERDSRVCNSGDIWFTPNGTGKPVYDSAQIYRNQIYLTTASFATFVRVNWGGGSPLKQIVTDNFIFATGLPVTVFDFAFTDWKTAGSFVDRNHYYVSNSSSKNFVFHSNIYSNNGSPVSFSQWQAAGWDVNGTNGEKPDWFDPVKCNFEAWEYK
jgi:hypothetical protein